MKALIFLATIATTISVIALPSSVRAQGYPYGGSSSTTIYVPSTETTTTTTITTTPVQSTQTIIAPRSNSLPSTTVNPYYNSFPNSTTYGSGYPMHGHRRHHQPTVIFPQSNSYPGAIHSTCSISIIGSPIPSPVALDRSGKPCR